MRYFKKIEPIVNLFLVFSMGALVPLSPVAFSAELSQAVPASFAADRRAELEQELLVLEKEIQVQRSILEEKQRENVTLERDIAILNARIERARLSIRARTLAIEKLQTEIRGKENTIDELSEKLAREKESLAQLIRKTNEYDSYSFAEIVLSNQNISDFFIDLDSFASIKEALNNSFLEINTTKATTEGEKVTLESKVSEELELKRLQEIEAANIQSQEREKQKILKESRGEEAVYQEVLKGKEKTAAEIRATLFSLRDSTAIPFGDAYRFATEAERVTGVRAALILGTLAYETNLGENIGTGNWRADMHPTRDVPVFERITQELGLNPDAMPVSARPCSKAERDRVGPGKPCGYGWGGAMGPAQFIPSTWVLYQDRIGEATGQNPPSPWEPRTAIFAAAILLMDNGADGRTRASERLAALRYFAGWANATKPAYASYGDNVIELADGFQRQIDILQREG